MLVAPDAIWVAEIPERRRVGRSRRDADRAPRRRKLDADRLRLAASLAAQDRTLREIAAEVGVSHETVRAALTAWRTAA